MNKHAAEGIVDAYAWAVELALIVEGEAKVKADGVYDTLREFLVEELTNDYAPWQFKPRRDA